MKAADKDDCKAMPKDGMDKDKKKKMPFKKDEADAKKDEDDDRDAAVHEGEVPDEEENTVKDEDEHGVVQPKKSKKSLVTADTLSKSLDLLKSFAQAELEKSDSSARKTGLLQKALQGVLSEEENDELYRLNSGIRDAEDETLPERIERSMQPADSLRKSHDDAQGTDVAEYLQGFHEQITKSLSLVAQEVEGLSKRQHTFNLLHAKASVQTGTVIKSLADKLGAYQSTMARAPKSMGLNGAVPMAKSFGGQTPSGALQSLNKSQVCQALTAMYKDNLDKGGNGHVAGFDLGQDIAAYEISDNAELHPGLQDQVQKFILRTQAGA